MSNKIVVLTAPSGAGKSTIARRVLEALPSFRFSVSATTRDRRPDEVDGVHYHFLTPAAFADAVEAGEFLEYEEVYGGVYYGTLRRAVEAQLLEFNILLDIDVNGAASVKRVYGDRALAIFIRPPSLHTLRQRLTLRATESRSSLEERIRKAALEMARVGEFDVVVVNDDLEKAVEETIARIRSFITIRS